MSSPTIEPLAVWVCGSDPQCDVVVAGPGVSAKHCLIAKYPKGYALQDLGSAGGTWHNGRQLQARAPTWVQPSDQIRLGPSAMLPWPEERSSATAGGRQLGATQRTITIGRSPENSIVLDYPMISREHAKLTINACGRMVLEDLGSTNGTAVGHPGNRIRSAEVRAEQSVFFGSFKIRVSRLLESQKLALGGATQEAVGFQGTEMIIGRDPKCDYPLENPMISWHHARLRKTPGGIEIEDLDSRNGTFVNGARVTGKVTLKTGSEIGLGSIRFRLMDETGNLAKRDYSDNVTIEAAGVVVELERGGVRRRLLDPVSLTVFPYELVALMGPAGAGKTTLLKAINGYSMPAAGHVLFNGEDLYANQEQFRLQVGYVPQDDILHPQLTVREALYYTAKLRTDLRDNEIEARTMQVLRDLNIDDIAGRLIGSAERKVISGGQRKRVNIAMELLSEPSILFLDEPTSGLSSYDAYQVVRLLRRLADCGKTIICTIHQPSVDIFKEFDSLLMVARDKGETPGTLAYFGPAYPESIEFFNPNSTDGETSRSPERLMTGLATRTATDWARDYQGSPYCKDFIEARSGRVLSPDTQPAKPKREFGIGQMITLARRNLLLKLRDRAQTVILLAQAPLFAVLLGIVFHGLTDRHFTDPAKWTEFCGKIATAQFLMVVAAVWFGCNNAARDIVGETIIFRRERMVNLRLPSYLFSKIAVLALLCLFQCTALLAIDYYVCKLSGPFGVLLAVLLLASLVGTVLGLFISALSPTTESAIALLPLLLLPFILLGGGIQPLHQMPQTARWIAAFTPTRWAYEANLLEEARSRNASFQNELEQKFLDCQGALAQCQPRAAAARRQAPPAAAAARTEADIASTAFPEPNGRTGIARSFEVLGVYFGILVVLILGVLRMKPVT